jgi:hypothetical protein
MTDINPPDLSGDINELPDPSGGDLPTSYEGGTYDIDGYHGEVANRRALRSKTFLGFDPKNGFFKVGEEIIACGPNQPNLFCTIAGINFPWQYWDGGNMICTNPNPGQQSFGDWNEGGVARQVNCAACPKNSANGASGQSICKDSVQIAMSLLLNGREVMALFRSTNFKIVGDVNRFLDGLERAGQHLKNCTVEIGKGDATELKGGRGKLYGWRLTVKSEKPLTEFLKSINQK